jgi:hypothetical protein
MIYSSSLLPVFAPRSVTVKTLCNGTHVISDLIDSTTVADVAAELHARLVLPPFRKVLLTHWGRALEPARRLMQSGLHTASQLEASIKYADPDRAGILTRVRLSSPHLITRHVEVYPAMLVSELKAEITAFLKRGVHIWYGPDGTPIRAEGATLLCCVTRPLDTKNLTSSMARGEQFVQVGLGGDKKDKWKVRRTATGHLAQVGFDDAVKLLLPAKEQALSYNGVPLADHMPLSAYSILQNDAVLLNFESPVNKPAVGKNAKKASFQSHRRRPHGAGNPAFVSRWPRRCRPSVISTDHALSSFAWSSKNMSNCAMRRARTGTLS